MLKFNRLKFLNDVEEHQARCAAMSRKRAEITELKFEIRRAKERLASVEHQKLHTSRRDTNPALVAALNTSIENLNIEIAHREEWRQSLESGRDAEAERNQALGTVIGNMRRLLQKHGVVDPSLVPIA